MRSRGPAEVATPGILTAVRFSQYPATMAPQTTDNGHPTNSAGKASTRGVRAPRREPLRFAWALFIAVWLLYPAGFVVQMLQSSESSLLQMLAFLASMAAFVAMFLWLMLRYPFLTRASMTAQRQGKTA